MQIYHKTVTALGLAFIALLLICSVQVANGLGLGPFMCGAFSTFILFILYDINRTARKDAERANRINVTLEALRSLRKGIAAQKAGEAGG